MPCSFTNLIGFVACHNFFVHRHLSLNLVPFVSERNGTRLSVNPIKERSWDGKVEFQNEKCTSEFTMAFARTP
jgi:hypothetical protein